MTEFKKGDRVRVTEDNYRRSMRKGDLGFVESVGPISGVYVVRGDSGAVGDVDGRRLELVEPEPKFKTGDRLRITVEGEFFEETDTWLGLNGVAVLKDTDGVDILNVEKVEPPKPPVEKFGPGDFVRYKNNRATLLLANKGYTYVQSNADHGVGRFFEYGKGGLSADWFTSENVERVTLVEPPL